jgi:hypothetical protein
MQHDRRRTFTHLSEMDTAPIDLDETPLDLSHGNLS